MKQKYQLTKLSNLLKRVERFEDVDPLKEYHFAGTYSFGRGIFAGERKLGSDFRLPKVQRISTGDFVYCKIMAWEGAFGLVPKEADNCVMSGAFIAYELDHTQVDPNYLAYYFKVPSVWKSVGGQSTGTNVRRRSLHPDQFEKTDIPLPSLDEQLRIVARIEELAARIEESRGLRREAVEDAERILAGVEFRIWPDKSLEKAPCLEQVTTFLSRGRQSDQGDSKHYLIKTQHVQQGNYVKSQITLAPEVAAKVLPEAVVRRGDILVACSAAGCLGRVACFLETDQLASTDTHVAIARANSQIILPEYLYAYLRGAQGQVQLRSRERGDWMREKVGFRLTELNLADLKRVPVPLPPLSEQRRIVTYLDDLQAKIGLLKQFQNETSAELDALLPSILDKAFKGEL